jgi:fluoride exporter
MRRARARTRGRREERRPSPTLGARCGSVHEQFAHIFATCRIRAPRARMEGFRAPWRPAPPPTPAAGPRAGAPSSAVRADARELAAVFAGGFLGAVARAALAQALPHQPGTWPWATFLVNVAGAALLGYGVTRLQERLPPSAYRRPFLGTGVCGALTTFSTMQVELLQMLDRGEVALAASYAAASLAVGLLAVAVATNGVRRARLAR